MAPGQDQRLEKLIDEVLGDGNFQAMDVFLKGGIQDGATLKCSRRFLTKLDKLVNRSLDHNEAKPASIGIAILYKCGKNLSLFGVQGLSGIVAQGLVRKMVNWFEKCRQLWVQGGPQRDETLLNLAEDFFESLMVVHEASNEGTYQITESLLYPIGKLAADPRIYIMIQKEAIRKFNIILDKIPVQLKKGKNILSSQEAKDVMTKLAGRILDGGDYDLQTALIEALCRMATSEQRKELADQWFTLGYVASAFIKIHDSEFETDCRKFLNLVNGIQGDRRRRKPELPVSYHILDREEHWFERVYSYPCMDVFLDKHELLMPSDEKLEEFWIDFNLGSQSISFYFTLADGEAQDGQWDTICITENEVQSYTVTDMGSQRVLRLKLSELVCVGVVEGANLTIHFSSTLDILQAALAVYGHIKNKSFVGKSSTSVAKTAIKLIMDDSSQDVVPESQVRLGNERENNHALCWQPPPPAPLKVITPAKRKISESTTFITSSAGSSVCGASPFSVMPANTPSKGKVKPALEMVHSCKRQGQSSLGELNVTEKTTRHGMIPSSTTMKSRTELVDTSPKSKASKVVTKNMAKKYHKHIPLEKAVEMVQAEQGEEQDPLVLGYIPDTQPTMKTARSIPSRLNKVSIAEMLMMSTQRNDTLLKPELQPNLEQQQECPSSAQRASVLGSGPISHKQLHAQLTQRLEEVIKDMNQGPEPQELSRSQGKQPKDKGGIKGPLTPIPAPQKPNLKAKATASSKEKRDAEATGSMVKLISSHYKNNTSTTKARKENIPLCWVPPLINKSIFAKSWLPTTKKEVSKSTSFIKSYCNTRKKSTAQREDIFAFHADPPPSIGGKGKKNTESFATVTSSGGHSSWAVPSTTKKGQPTAKQGRRCVKKHLFSDTDTDSALTETSWLRESSTKVKPIVNDYMRHAPTKTKAPAADRTYESPDLPLPTAKPGKGNSKTDKKRPRVKKAVEQPKEQVKLPARSRPQRTAATAMKSYREPDTDGSQSESENPPVPKRHSSTGLQQKSERPCQGTAELKKKKIPPTKVYTGLHNSRTTRLASFTPSPSPIERMRSAERPAPTTSSPLFTPLRTPLSNSPNPQSKYTPATILGLPKPVHSAVSNKLNFQHSSFYSKKGKCNSSKTPSLFTLPSCPLLTQMSQTPAPHPTKRPSLAQLSPIQQTLSTSPQSPLSEFSQPLLELELNKSSMLSPPQLQLPQTQRECLSQGLNWGYKNGSVVSLSQSSSKSSVPITKLKVQSAAALALANKYKKTPSDKDHQMSGPSRKRHISHPSSSNSEEDEKEESPKDMGKRHYSARMRPRKLFKSSSKRLSKAESYEEQSSLEKEEEEKVESWPKDGALIAATNGYKHIKMSSEGEVNGEVATSHTANSNQWAEDDVDMDNYSELPNITVATNELGSMCHQFSSELQWKVQNRSRRMEVYTKQSLKTVQQHVSSLSLHVGKYRNERLENVCKVFMEEINNLEQDNNSLVDMEKNLTSYWKKQSMALRSYHNQRTRRLETVKNALQSHVCHSLEYEGKIFTSQMCLMSKDMKSLQDRLFKEMREEELQSVRRGLQALFLTDGVRF